MSNMNNQQPAEMMTEQQRQRYHKLCLYMQAVEDEPIPTEIAQEFKKLEALSTQEWLAINPRAKFEQRYEELYEKADYEELSDEEFAELQELYHRLHSSGE